MDLEDVIRDLDFDVSAHDSSASHERFSSETERIRYFLEFDFLKHMRAPLPTLTSFARDLPRFVVYDYGERLSEISNENAVGEAVSPIGARMRYNRATDLTM